MTETFATGSTTTFTVDHSGTYTARVTNLDGEQSDYPLIGWATVIGDGGYERRIGIEPVLFVAGFGVITMTEFNSLADTDLPISIIPATATAGGDR